MREQPKIGLVISVDELREESDELKELLVPLDGDHFIKKDAVPALLAKGSGYYEGGPRFEEPLFGIIGEATYVAHSNEIEMLLEIPTHLWDENLVQYLLNPANGWVMEK